ncbi:hypothetical protein [Nocardia sp. NPDC057440]
MRSVEHGARLGLAVVAILAGSPAVAGPANAGATPALTEVDFTTLDLAA